MGPRGVQGAVDDTSTQQVIPGSLTGVARVRSTWAPSLWELSLRVHRSRIAATVSSHDIVT